MQIRPIEDKDIPRITDIYNWYISNTAITFELDAIAPTEMQQRVQQKLQKYDWLVGEVDQTIVGYAYYGAYHTRAAYSHTLETSIYLDQIYTRRGFGKALYSALLASAKSKGFRELIGIIALPNLGSIILHEKLGFEKIGVLKKVGYKFDRYIDVGIWQRSL